MSPPVAFFMLSTKVQSTDQHCVVYSCIWLLKGVVRLNSCTQLKTVGKENVLNTRHLVWSVEYLIRGLTWLCIGSFDSV